MLTLLNDDLLAKLGLSGSGDAGGEDALTGIESDVVTVPPSPTVFYHDGFGRTRGEGLIEESTRVSKAMKDASISDEKAIHTANDFFAAAFDPNPKMTPNPEDKCRAAFIDALMGSNDIHDLRQETCGSVIASTVAAAELIARYSQYVIESGQKPEGGRGGRKRGNHPEHKPSALQQQIGAMQAAGGACKQAKKAVEESKDAADAFGLGGGGGGDGTLGTDRISAVVKKVKNSAMLRKVAELAGRWRRLAAGKQRQKTTHGYDDVVGTELSGDAARIVPSELAALADDVLCDDAERRLVEKSMLSREYHGQENVGKGPIVVVVDESGSMSGAKIENAKAFALTMAWIARKQKRWCALAGFSGGRDMNYVCLPPSRWDENALMTWTQHFYSGGTSLDVPLDVLPGMWPEMVAAGLKRGRTDLIVVTDGIVSCPPELAESFLRFKKDEKVKMTTIGIGVDNVGDLEALSDKTVCVRNLVAVDGEVADVLSV